MLASCSSSYCLTSQEKGIHLLQRVRNIHETPRSENHTHTHTQVFGFEWEREGIRHTKNKCCGSHASMLVGIGGFASPINSNLLTNHTLALSLVIISPCLHFRFSWPLSSFTTEREQKCKKQLAVVYTLMLKLRQVYCPLVLPRNIYIQGRAKPSLIVESRNF
jgi:hypothetical protein